MDVKFLNVLEYIHCKIQGCTIVEGEPTEACLLLLCLSLQHCLIETHSILIVVISTVQRHTKYFSPTVHRSNPPHRHTRTQTIEVSAGQEVGSHQGIGGGAAGGNVDPSSSSAAALGVVVLPRRTLKEVQHFEDSLLSIRLMEEESDGQRRVAWNSVGKNLHNSNEGHRIAHNKCNIQLRVQHLRGINYLNSHTRLLLACGNYYSPLYRKKYIFKMCNEVKLRYSRVLHPTKNTRFPIV